MSPDSTLDIAQDLIAHLKRESDALCEVFVCEQDTLRIEVQHQHLEQLIQSHSVGTGIRVVDEKRLGYSFTNSTFESDLVRAADRALSAASSASPDHHNVLPFQLQPYRHLDLLDSEIAATSISRKVDMVLELECAALEFDPVIRSVGIARYDEVSRHLTVVNCQGLCGQYSSGICQLLVSPIARKGDESQTFGELFVTRLFDELNPVRVARAAASKAKSFLGGRRLEKTTLPVIYSPRAAAGLLGHLAAALSGEAVLRGRSVFRDKLHMPIAPPSIQMEDDGLLAGGIGTAPFDDEGAPSGCTPILRDGILRQYLHNCYTASRMGTTTTGNGKRRDYRHRPGVGTNNFRLVGGNSSEADLIQSLDKGLVVERVFDVGGVNPVNGSYSVGAYGYLVEKGCRTVPVSEVALTGNLMQMLSSIAGVASEPAYVPTQNGVCGSPAILLPDMVVCGSAAKPKWNGDGF